jgi:L-cysteine:1D-myo-inositol 2-amino-2-deoxy-alpha-D-glucopyranoside ligase
MSKSKGNLVFVSRLRGDRVDPMAIRLGLLSAHYRTDRMWTADVLTRASARLLQWRQATALDTGPDAADTVARLRQHLNDDLDTPRALAAAEALHRRGTDADAPGLVRDAVDALLGVALGS